MTQFHWYMTKWGGEGYLYRQIDLNIIAKYESWKNACSVQEF